MLLNERGSRPRSDPTRPAVSDRVAGKGAPSAPVSLAGDDHIVEWRQGWIRRWRVDGDERPIPAFGRLRRAITVGGNVNLQLLVTGSVPALREYLPSC